MVAIASAIVSAPVVAARSVAMKPASKATTFKAATVSAKKASAFQVWNPIDNKFFETFSFLPPLSDDEIIKQVDYIVRNGFTPCLEFSSPEQAYVQSINTGRMGGSVTCNYFDNRYWTMWKLPMFGCTDGAQVVAEIKNCTKAFPEAYIRLVAFDNVKQVQCSLLLVHRPAAGSEAQPVETRSVA
jgi:ribulose-bisphosphate carboxylase small chain